MLPFVDLLAAAARPYRRLPNFVRSDRPAADIWRGCLPLGLVLQPLSMGLVAALRQPAMVRQVALLGASLGLLHLLLFAISVVLLRLLGRPYGLQLGLPQASRLAALLGLPLWLGGMLPLPDGTIPLQVGIKLLQAGLYSGGLALLYAGIRAAWPAPNERWQGYFVLCGGLYTLVYALLFFGWAAVVASLHPLPTATATLP